MGGEEGATASQNDFALTYSLSNSVSSNSDNLYKSV